MITSVDNTQLIRRDDEALPHGIASKSAYQQCGPPSLVAPLAVYSVYSSRVAIFRRSALGTWVYRTAVFVSCRQARLQGSSRPARVPRPAMVLEVHASCPCFGQDIQERGG
jgi:hypothetical protein